MALCDSGLDLLDQTTYSLSLLRLTDSNNIKSQLLYRLSQVLCPTRHKIGHFGDMLPNQSLRLILKKLNQTKVT